jgi:Na+/H+ antiporter NhaC
MSLSTTADAACRRDGDSPVRERSPRSDAADPCPQGGALVLQQRGRGLRGASLQPPLRLRWGLLVGAVCVSGAPATACGAQGAADAAATHPYGMWSLVPPLVAVGLAIATQRVYWSLGLAVACGALLLEGGDPAAAIHRMAEGLLWRMLTDGDLLRVFACTSLLAAMVGVMHASGSMQALVDAIARWARTRRRGQVSGWLLGLVVFFDDYANSLLLGSTLRPMSDRLRISREKLAFIVDATAAPVAGLALVSTWVATEINYIGQGCAELGLAAAQYNAFELFVQSIPYRFYPLLMLVFVLLVAWMGRDFGPMWRAERRALDRAAAGPHEPRADGPAPEGQHCAAPRPPRALHALLSVIVVVCVVFASLVVTGRTSLAADGALSSDITLWECIRQGNSYRALLYGALAGLLTAMMLAVEGKRLSLQAAQAAALSGARTVLPAMAILWLASTIRVATEEPRLQRQGTFRDFDVVVEQDLQQRLRVELTHRVDGRTVSEVVEADDPAQLRRRSQLAAEACDALAAQQPTWTGGLGTGVYLAELLRGRLPVVLLPTVVFVLASGVAFATGTSWGTMGILMPLVVGVAYRLLAESGPQPAVDQPLMLAAISGVLAGAIFGDHCSPISDTTVLSSAASGCNHMAHVWTQLPYALLVGAVAVVCGTLPSGWGWPVWSCGLMLLAGSLLLVVVLYLLGRPVEPLARQEHPVDEPPSPP